MANNCVPRRQFGRSKKDGESREHLKIGAALAPRSRDSLANDNRPILLKRVKIRGAALAVNLDGGDVRQPTGTEF